jgi:adenylate cyclase
MKLSLFQKSAFSRREKILSFLLITAIALGGAIQNPFRSFDQSIQRFLFMNRDDTTYITNAIESIPYFDKLSKGQLSLPIKLIKIDDKSIEALKTEWPIPRSIYADVIEIVEKCNPRVIGLDLLFTEKSPHPEDDRKLAATLKKYHNVILGGLHEADPETGRIKVQNPIASLIAGWSDEEKSERIGFVDFGLQEESGIIRQTYLMLPGREKTLFSFDALLLAHYLNIPLSSITTPPGSTIQHMGEIKIPVHKGLMWINYVKKENMYYNIYRSCPLIDVLKADKPENIKSLFEDSIVLIGVTATQGFETKDSPLGTTTGPEIHVNIMSTVLCQKFLKESAPFQRFLFVLIPSLLMVFLIPMLSPGAGFALYCILNAAIMKFISYDFLHNGKLHTTAFCLVLLFVTYAVMTIAYFAKLHRHRKHLKNLLLELAPVPEPVLERIIAQDQGQVRLGGEKVELTVLFSDIRGYTNLSQNLDPREVMDTLNEYYSATGSIYKKNGGMVFDTMGDGQMLVFGADEASRANHAFQACKAALELLEVLNELNARWESQNRKSVSIGIGINTGPVSLGFLGTRGHGQHKQYAAIGDTTNVASRIEGLTKQHQAAIIISESTYVKTRELIEIEPLPPTKVKGKDEPLNIYKVTGLKVKEKQG